jgi:hypothetical protein
MGSDVLKTNYIIGLEQCLVIADFTSFNQI